MRHQHTGRKLNRTSSHRLMMLHNMVAALFEHGRIETTNAKAKELRKLADNLITLGKRGNLHARRQASSIVNSKRIVQKLFNEIAPRFAERSGGYTHIYKTRTRPGDGADLSVIELIPAEKEASRGRTTSKKKSAQQKS